MSDSGRLPATTSEQLESRALLTALMASISGIDLVVEETGGNTNDDVTISVDATHVTVSVVGDTIDASGVPGALGNLSGTVMLPLSSFAGFVTVNTHHGDDTLTVDSLDSAFIRTLEFIDAETVNLNSNIPGAVTGNATTINVAATARIQDGIDTAGAGATVNVSPGTYDEFVNIDRTLTLQGTTATPGDVVINPTFGEDAIHVDNGAADVTIRNLQLGGNAVNPIEDGLRVLSSSGTLTVQNVNIIEPRGVGFDVQDADVISISNLRIADGASDGFVVATGSGLLSVTIQNSEFTNNVMDGIRITGAAEVALTNVTANGNEIGVVVAGADSFFDTDGTYSYNDDGGIELSTIAGNVTLIRTTLEDNDANNDEFGDGFSAFGFGAIGGNFLVQGVTARVTLPGVTHQQDGIFVDDVFGSVIFEDAAGPARSNLATGNDDDGVEIIDGTTATFTNGVFSDNIGDGLDLSIFSGTVTLTDITAGNNGQEGVQVEESNAIDVIGGLFTGNTQDGLDFFDNGNITLTDVTAEGNDDDGVDFQFANNVTVTRGSFSSNDEFGFELRDVGGAIELNNATADTNGLAAVDAFQITSLSVDGGSYSGNIGDGIRVVAATGSVTLTNVTANNNTNGSNGEGVFVASADSVTITGGSFSGNDITGIDVGEIAGAVMVNGVTANNNSNTVDDGDGLFVFTADSVTVMNSTFNDNFDSGLEVDTVLGSVTLADVTADGNTNGLLSAGIGSLNVTGGSFSRNDFAGLDVFDTTGAVALTNVTTDGNDDGGFLAFEAGSVTITGGTFSANGNSGIDVQNIVAAVILDNVTANNNVNFSFGALVALAAHVEILGGVYSDNSAHGILLNDIAGTATLTNVVADGNDEDGLEIGTVSEVVVNAGRFTDSTESGIDAFDVGTLTITDVVITGNALDTRIDIVGTANIDTSIGMTIDDLELNTPSVGGQGFLQLKRAGVLQNVVHFTALTTLDIDFDGGDDTVTVAPHAITAIHLDGGDPAAAVGDSLTYFADGVTSFNIGPATITTTGQANIDYVNFETIATIGAAATLEDVTFYNRDAALEDGLSADSTGQRSIIRHVEVVIDGAIILPTGPVTNAGFVLQNLTASTNVGLTVDSVTQLGGKTIIVLSFTSSLDTSGSLTDGNYRLTIDGNVLGVDTNGDGSPGRLRTIDFHRLFGDSDGDRDVDGGDYMNMYRAYYGDPAYITIFDVDDDGAVADDVMAFFMQFGRILEPFEG